MITLPSRLDELGATALAVSLSHAMFAGSRSWSHRDPFDRVLVAQATMDDLILVTADAALVGPACPRILSW